MRAYLAFEDGYCKGLSVKVERKTGPVSSWVEADVPALIERALLSATDRMILEKLASRVEKLAGQLSSGGENVS